MWARWSGGWRRGGSLYRAGTTTCVYRRTSTTTTPISSACWRRCGLTRSCWHRFALPVALGPKHVAVRRTVGQVDVVHRVYIPDVRTKGGPDDEHAQCSDIVLGLLGP